MDLENSFLIEKNNFTIFKAFNLENAKKTLLDRQDQSEELINGALSTNKGNKNNLPDYNENTTILKPHQSIMGSSTNASILILNIENTAVVKEEI